MGEITLIKRKNYLVILIVACVLMGCISTSPKDVIEIRLGVYVTNDANALSLPA